MQKNLLDVHYEKFKLDNGLEVILYQDKTIPLAAVNVWYKVGSANEKRGKTGLAHLFEHMMFQGSENVKKEEHFRFIEEIGGRLNGSTSFDRTNYYETVPSTFLETALWLEADRMGFFLSALTKEKLDNQKDVVMNERRQRYDNQPYGLAWELIFTNLYPESHPYSWQTIGFMEDIEKFELEDARNFFETYYAPNNASLVIAGDIDYQKTKALVKKYFDEIPSGNPIPKIVNGKPALQEVKKMVHPDNVHLPRLHLAWHSDKMFGEDDAVLDILSDILSGSKNGRLHKALVYDKQIAQDVAAFQFSAKYYGPFIIFSTAKPGVELHTIREEIFKEIEKLKDDGITPEELQRAKNSIKSSYIYSLQNIDTLANQLNNYNFFRDEPNSFAFDLERYNAVTEEKIIEAIEKYLDKPFVELSIVPKEKNFK